MFILPKNSKSLQSDQRDQYGISKLKCLLHILPGSPGVSGKHSGGQPGSLRFVVDRNTNNLNHIGPSIQLRDGGSATKNHGGKTGKTIIIPVPFGVRIYHGAALLAMLSQEKSCYLLRPDQISEGTLLVIIYNKIELILGLPGSGKTSLYDFWYYTDRYGYKILSNVQPSLSHNSYSHYHDHMLRRPWGPAVVDISSYRLHIEYNRHYFYLLSNYHNVLEHFHIVGKNFDEVISFLRPLAHFGCKITVYYANLNPSLLSVEIARTKAWAMENLVSLKVQKHPLCMSA
jgi:hypothetical protein